MNITERSKPMIHGFMVLPGLYLTAFLYQVYKLMDFLTQVLEATIIG